MKKYLIYFVGVMTLYSCQEPIDIKLDKTDTKLVIEAQYSMLEQGKTVAVSNNATYFGNDSGKVITNASIKMTIGDTTITLKNLNNGIYHSDINSKYLFKTYNLEVETDGKTYKASSTMPQPVKIDSVAIEQSKGILGRTGPDKDSLYHFTIKVYLKDPIGANYYRIILFKNGERVTEDIESTTQLFDDAIITPNESLEMSLVLKCRGNETVKVELISFDKASYDYQVSLLTTIMSAGGSFSVPENPTTNFNNDVLGYFSAYSSDTASCIVPMPEKK